MVHIEIKMERGRAIAKSKVLLMPDIRKKSILNKLLNNVSWNKLDFHYTRKILHLLWKPQTWKNMYFPAIWAKFPSTMTDFPFYFFTFSLKITKLPVKELPFFQVFSSSGEPHFKILFQFNLVCVDKLFTVLTFDKPIHLYKYISKFSPGN